MFPVVEFFVDVLLNANMRGRGGFFPVDLMHVIERFAELPKLHTVSLMIVPTFRSMFRSNMPISLAVSFWRIFWEETRPDLLQYIHVVGVYQLRQRVTDHSSMKGKLCDKNQFSTRSSSHCSPLTSTIPCQSLTFALPDFSILSTLGVFLIPDKRPWMSSAVVILSALTKHATAEWRAAMTDSEREGRISHSRRRLRPKAVRVLFKMPTQELHSWGPTTGHNAP